MGNTPLRRAILGLAGAIGFVVLLVLLFDVGGWGQFALDLALSSLLQFGIALLLFGLVVGAYALSAGTITPVALHPVRLAVFALAAVVAMFLAPRVLRRPVDGYDVAQTLVLVVLFHWLARRVERAVGRRPRWPGGSVSTHRPRPHIPPPRRRPRPRPRPSAAAQSLFRDLVRKVGGSEATAQRLVEYERRRDPRASELELVRRAIQRWERDNQ
jgi:hypothetical protein